MLALKFVCWWAIVAIILVKDITPYIPLFIGMVFALTAIYIAERVAK
jgi:hypothetical protein